MFEKLFDKYDCLLFFDTETTGLSPKDDNIIELAGKAFYKEGVLKNTDKTEFHMDSFIRLPDGKRVPDNIVELTRISDEVLNEHGEDAVDVFDKFYRLSGKDTKTLLIAHNAQFDISFMMYSPIADRIRDCDYLDTYTIARDRKGGRHKLGMLIDYYSVPNVQNSHRAIDDVNALVGVADAMYNERRDFDKYINVFGYYSKYGEPAHVNEKVTYHAQIVGAKGPGEILPELAKMEQQLSFT